MQESFQMKLTINKYMFEKIKTYMQFINDENYNFPHYKYCCGFLVLSLTKSKCCTSPLCVILRWFYLLLRMKSHKSVHKK